jgi:negative modulator of initiation of replication
MNAPQPRDEFDAARIVVDVLRVLQPDEQARAIRYAQEKLAVIGSSALPIDGIGAVRSASTPSNNAKTGHELMPALSDPEFAQQHAVVDKMLYILSAAYKLKPDAFEKVLLIQGRGRRYFAKSEMEIKNSGKSTQPRNITGTEYWVMTNSPTPQKQELLGRVLRLLGFSQSAVKGVVATLG